MRWFYFIRHDQQLVPWTPCRSVARPVGALPDNGDPLTPWFTEENHCDDDHVHVYAANQKAANRIAEQMLSRVQ